MITTLTLIDPQKQALQAQVAQDLEQIMDVHRQHLGAKLSDAEWVYFKAVCQRMGLDPLQRQIYALKRKAFEDGGWTEKLSIQTGIDGYRLTAQRTGERDGEGTTEWCGCDGRWVDVWLEREPPAAARVTIYRKGQAHPYVRVARFDEYAQRTQKGLTRMWESMPALMIAKCAEALALRAAFPAELAGVYTTEEMGQAENPRDAAPPTGKPERVAPLLEDNTAAELAAIKPWLDRIESVRQHGDEQQLDQVRAEMNEQLRRKTKAQGAALRTALDEARADLRRAHTEQPAKPKDDIEQLRQDLAAATTEGAVMQALRRFETSMQGWGDEKLAASMAEAGQAAAAKRMDELGLSRGGDEP